MSIIDKIATKVTVKTPSAASPIEPVVRRDFDDVIDFIDFCIERDEDIKQEIELMFMYYIKQKLKPT